MTSIDRMKTKFERAFSPEQAEILSEVINDAYSELVKTSDFNELKEIVKDIGIKVGELAEAQKRTENRVEELAEAQKRTEIELHELVVDHKETRKQLGGLTQDVGYGLEDKIMPFMPDFVKKNYGMDATLVERRNIVYPDGKYDELNIYVEGIKEGKNVYAIGECKSQPGKKDIDKFNQLIERVRTVLKGEIFLFVVGYSFDPAVENYIRENYPETGIYMSFEFELKYSRTSLFLS